MIIIWHKAKTLEQFVCNGPKYQPFTAVILDCEGDNLNNEGEEGASPTLEFGPKQDKEGTW